jgi:hypothetical protein
MQHVPAADRVPGHHRDHGFREATDLDLQVEHVEPADALLVHVSVVAPDPLVAAAREGVGAGAGQDHDADRGVVPRHVEGGDQLPRGERPEGVAHLGPVHRDLRDPAGGLVADVGPIARRLPVDHMTINS